MLRDIDRDSALPEAPLGYGENVPGNETIVAISTPPGRGGIGIVRLSGSRSVEIAEGMLRLRNPLAHGQARFAEVLDVEAAAGSAVGGGSRIDEAVVTYFAAPNSYTGDDLVEIAAHGSPVVLNALVRQALAAGATLAEPGEFTQRAFLSGRIDLTQAEAVRDLIEAQTLYQVRVAARQMGGSLSRGVAPMKQALVELIALLEAGIDFAEDDIDVAPEADILLRIGMVREQLLPIEASFARGRIIHAGLTLAIVGRPNVGKSSLFNRLVERERAIVTATAGTTRDLVTERVSLGGIPVELVDTAGLRDAFDEAESIGIRKSREALAEADIVLVVVNAGAPLAEDERALLDSLEGRRVVVVANKADLVGDGFSGGLDLDLVRTSAFTGEGIPDLRARILSMVRGSGAEDAPGMLTNLRQHQAVAQTLAGLDSASEAVGRRTPHEMVLLDLYSALRHLDSLTGETTSDDILNLIFSSFCIGK
ncbi:MAG TPA: tRNA uridine-5-carboxymethylaminomethyl(34) synthesis GTPase MnmE [Acidisarcina sp.]